MTEPVVVKLPCDRCAHSPDDHRRDDTLDTDLELWEFRCVWTADPHDFGLRRDCGCEDFVGEFGVVDGASKTCPVCGGVLGSTRFCPCCGQASAGMRPKGTSV
jgi:hypothetical protein